MVGCSGSLVITVKSKPKENIHTTIRHLVTTDFLSSRSGSLGSPLVVKYSCKVSWKSVDWFNT